MILICSMWTFVITTLFTLCSTCIECLAIFIGALWTSIKLQLQRGRAGWSKGLSNSSYGQWSSYLLPETLEIAALVIHLIICFRNILDITFAATHIFKLVYFFKITFVIKRQCIVVAFNCFYPSSYSSPSTTAIDLSHSSSSESEQQIRNLPLVLQQRIPHFTRNLREPYTSRRLQQNQRHHCISKARLAIKCNMWKSSMQQ